MNTKHERTKRLVYVIDDEQAVRLSCSKILLKQGFIVKTFEDGIKGLAGIKQNKPDLIVVDLKMPKIGGIDVIKKVHEIDLDICIIVITGYATIETAVEAMKAGAYDFLAKPFTPDELRLMVKRGLERIDLVRQSRQLKEEKEKLERQFITFVSHQLKSPLNAVQQYLDVLGHLKPSPEKQEIQDEWIRRALIRIKEMRELIMDWLTLAKIECQQKSEDIELMSIPQITDAIFKSMDEEAKKSNIYLISEFPENLSKIKAPKKCIFMLFSNLISNAIKYNNPNGSVKITVQEYPDSFHFYVSDTGIGIPENKLDLIFDEFYRIKNENTKSISGTGLGLAICKKITKNLKGSIEVQSKENKGSIFTVIIPKNTSE